MSWSSDFISQVPYGINPLKSSGLGLLFIEIGSISQCFDNIDVAEIRDKEGYRSTWYDVEGDVETE